jgi:hypothetical protein
MSSIKRRQKNDSKKSISNIKVNLGMAQPPAFLEGWHRVPPLRGQKANPRSQNVVV